MLAKAREWLGVWEYYPIVLDMVLSKQINIDEFVQIRPMSTIAETFDEAHKVSPTKRIVLTSLISKNQLCFFYYKTYIKNKILGGKELWL